MNDTNAAARGATRDVVVVAVLALFASVLFIDAKSVWLDEAVSIEYALGGPRNVLTGIALEDPNMSFYYALLSVWAKLVGPSEMAMRLPSAICAALTAPLVYLLGERFFGRRAGLIAGTLFALNAFIVEFGQTVRGYALLTLLVTAATWLFVHELDRPSRWTRIAYVITGVLAFHAHYFGALALLAHFVALLIIRGKGALTRETAFVAGGFALLCSPMVLLAAREGGDRTAWIQPPTLASVWETLFQFAGESGILLALLLGSAAYAVLSARRSGETGPVTILVAWCVLPFIVALAVSLVKPLFMPHYLIASVPPLLLLAAGGLTKLRAPVIAAAGAGTAIVFSVLGLVSYYREEGDEAFREAAAWIAPRQQPGDGIIFQPFYISAPYDYYQQRGDPPYPEKVSNDAVSERERVWLVYSYGHIGRRRREFDDVRASLSRSHRLKATQSFQRVEIEYYVK